MDLRGEGRRCSILAGFEEDGDALGSWKVLDAVCWSGKQFKMGFVGNSMPSKSLHDEKCVFLSEGWEVAEGEDEDERGGGRG